MSDDDSDHETQGPQRASPVMSDAVIMPSPSLNAAQRFAQGMERKGWEATDLDSFCKGKRFKTICRPSRSSWAPKHLQRRLFCSVTPGCPCFPSAPSLPPRAAGSCRLPHGNPVHARNHVPPGFQLKVSKSFLPPRGGMLQPTAGPHWAPH